MTLHIVLLCIIIFCLFNVSFESFQPYNMFTFPPSSSLYDDESQDINIILSNIFGNKYPIDPSVSFQPYPWYSKFPFAYEFNNVVEDIFNKYLTTYEMKMNKTLEHLQYFNNLEDNIILFKYNISGSSKKKSFTRPFVVTIELQNASKYFNNNEFLNIFPLSLNDIIVKYITMPSMEQPPSPNPFEPPIGNDQYYRNYFRIKNSLGLTTPFYTSKKDMELPQTL